MSEPKSQRWTWLLVGSLMANALLVGLLIGGGLARQHQGPGPEPRGEMAMARSIDRVVPDAQRAAVRGALRRAFSETRAERRDLRLARDELARQLANDTYDRDAVVAAFARMRAAEDQSKAALHEALASQLQALSPEQRRALLADMDEHSHRRRGRSRGGPED